MAAWSNHNISTFRRGTDKFLALSFIASYSPRSQFDSTPLRTKFYICSSSHSTAYYILLPLILFFFPTKDHPPLEKAVIDYENRVVAVVRNTDDQSNAFVTAWPDAVLDQRPHKLVEESVQL